MMTIQNLPYWCLIWIGIGFGIILVSVLLLATIHTKDVQYTHHQEKVFPMLMMQKQLEVTHAPNRVEGEKVYDQVEKLTKEGKSPEEIARQLRIGVGEVKLMQSLYAMR
ncbi:MAG: DUF6115 domain-containing protein [Cellulosilyticaceae bacterium]